MDTGENLAQSTNRVGNGGAVGPRNVRAANRRPGVDKPSGDRGTVDAPTAGDNGRVEVADGPARFTPWDSTASLRRRLLIAQSQVEALEKDATIKGKSRSSGAEFSYKGITAEQIITKAKAVLIANGILYTCDVLEQRSVSGNKTAVYVLGIFEDVDTGEFLERHAWGEGTDDADKGTAKATTNANKILLARTLNMSTTEYEGVDIVNHEPESRPAAVRDAQVLTDTAVKAWADTYKSALDGCATTSQLKAAREANATMMKHPDVPQRTKDYFIDKVAALEGVLENDTPTRTAPAPRGSQNRIAPTNEAGTA